MSVFVCLSVCLSAHVSQEPRIQTSPSFTSALPVARSSSGGVVDDVPVAKCAERRASSRTDLSGAAPIWERSPIL